MSKKQEIKSAFSAAKHDAAKPVELPNGSTCYMQPLSITDVKSIEDAQDPATGRVDLDFVFRQIFASLHVEPEGDRVFSDDELSGLLDIPFNHPMMSDLISAFNEVNGMSLEVLSENAASVGASTPDDDQHDGASETEDSDAVEQLKA